MSKKTLNHFRYSLEELQLMVTKLRTLLSEGEIILDSGMHQLEIRTYKKWTDFKIELEMEIMFIEQEMRNISLQDENMTEKHNEEQEREEQL